MPDQDYATKQDVFELKRELKQDMLELKGELKQDILDLKGELKQDMDQMQEHLIESMRDMQTEVLRAFHHWASPTDIKMRGHEERLTLMEERLREIERGLTGKH